MWKKTVATKLEIWFQQDGATAYTSLVSIETLDLMSSNRIISSYGDFPWLPRLYPFLRLLEIPHKKSAWQPLSSHQCFEISKVYITNISSDMMNTLEIA